VKNISKALLTTPRDPDPPERSLRDWLLVLLVTVLAVIEPFLVEGPAEWLAVGLSMVTACLLPWRRSYPLQINIAYVVAFILIDIVNAGDELISMVLGGIIITYALTRWSSGREAAIGLTILLVHYTFHNVIYATGFNIEQFTFAMGFWLLPVIMGGTMRYRAEVRRRLIEKARHSERAQLARELHDTVAHNVSAIAIQAQAARVTAASQPEAVIDPLKTIEEIASQTLTEMRKIVGALRVSSEPDTAPQPRLADIERLAKHSQEGPRIDISFSGKLDSLTPSVEAGLYRIAQEAITNALRHARHASIINVQIYGEENSVSLTVTDDGNVDSASVRESRGYGLTGMKERANLLGGHLEAGPEPDTGWRVRAVIPTGGM
jgi:signal transduction histidine kinase